MDTQNYANLTGLSNIISNCVEMLGLATGVSNLFLGWIPMACGAKGYSSKFYFACIANIVISLVTPMIANTMNQMARSSNLEMLLFLSIGLSLGLGLVTIILTLALFLAPALIAWREKLSSAGLIIGLNIGTILLPILWIPALIVASLAVAKRQAAPIVELIRQRRGNIEPATDSEQNGVPEEHE